MTTYLIISKKAELRESHARKLAEEKNIKTFDMRLLETEGSIGIEDVRTFQKQIMLKPIQGKNKAVIIKDAHTLTTEAQNALLKTLEEPPNNTYIYLLAENTNNLLPTILSRTTIITLDESPEFNRETLLEIENEIKNMFSASVGAKLKLAEKLSADKQKAIIWIEKALYSTRKIMLDNQTQAAAYIGLLESLQTTYEIIKTTNVNARLTLETMLLNSDLSFRAK